MKKTLFALFFLMLATVQGQVTARLSAADFKKMMDSKKGVLIDLRTSEELKNKGTIKGSQQIDFLSKDAETIIKSLDKNKTYYIFCAGGGRSGECLELMRNEGFKEVYELEKGYDDWKRKSFETEAVK